MTTIWLAHCLRPTFSEFPWQRPPGWRLDLRCLGGFAGALQIPTSAGHGRETLLPSCQCSTWSGRAPCRHAQARRHQGVSSLAPIGPASPSSAGSQDSPRGHERPGRCRSRSSGPTQPRRPGTLRRNSMRRPTRDTALLAWW